MSNPKVSVIIPVFNGERFIKESLESAINQSYKNLEIIVVDDGSTDGTAKVIATMADNRIKYLHTQNRGVSTARNYGIKNSDGEYIALLDYDDLWLSGKIEEQVKQAEKYPDAGLFYCRFYIIDGQGGIIGESNAQSSKDILKDLLLIGNIIGPPSSTLIRKKTFDEIGVFDTELSTSADWDLWIRITYKSNAVLLPDYLLKYRMHGKNMHSNITAQENDSIKILNKFFSSLPKKNNYFYLKRRSFFSLYLMLSKSYLKKGMLVCFLKNIFRTMFNYPWRSAYER
ncbi:MAG: glycosyltransferase [Candidatus Omnitrophica bacterium]|nr:glycosyltransferase [Candidatus Omnitrophota bacterium]